MMPQGRRYAPNKSLEMRAPILETLASGEQLNVTSICNRLGVSSDDGRVGYCLKKLAAIGVLSREPVPAVRGFTYLYRRTP